MNKRLQKQCFIASLLFAGYTTPAYAYLDPASGSMLFAAILGAMATVILFVKKIYYKTVNYFFSLFGREAIKPSQYDMVFYSEGRQYWNTFKPILEALEGEHIRIQYLTSDQEDQGLNYQSAQVDTLYIKSGNRCYSILNLLETKLCVLTTPGLDVLQIRRSKGVKHYAHIVHAPTTGTYKLYSFDYFDSVFCSGQHQISAIRELEAKRGTHAKQLFETGCVYMDEISRKLDEKNSNTQVKELDHKKQTTVLVAPSWGENALLNRFGSDFIKDLLQHGFIVIIRPHPQSYVSESKMLTQIEKELEGMESLSWDKSADSFNALAEADIMISDLSGVIFDCAFIFEKPVITLEFELDLRGLEANHLDEGLWELGMLSQVGQQISIDEINNLDTIIQKVLSKPNAKEDLQQLREQHLYHYKNAGNTAAKQLLEVLKQTN